MCLPLCNPIIIFIHTFVLNWKKSLGKVQESAKHWIEQETKTCLFINRLPGWCFSAVWKFMMVSLSIKPILCFKAICVTLRTYFQLWEFKHCGLVGRLLLEVWGGVSLFYCYREIYYQWQYLNYLELNYNIIYDKLCGVNNAVSYFMLLSITQRVFVSTQINSSAVVLYRCFKIINWILYNLIKITCRRSV